MVESGPQGHIHIPGAPKMAERPPAAPATGIPKPPDAPPAANPEPATPPFEEILGPPSPDEGPSAEAQPPREPQPAETTSAGTQKESSEPPEQPKREETEAEIWVKIGKAWGADENSATGQVITASVVDKYWSTDDAAIEAHLTSKGGEVTTQTKAVEKARREKINSTAQKLKEIEDLDKQKPPDYVYDEKTSTYTLHPGKPEETVVQIDQEVVDTILEAEREIAADVSHPEQALIARTNLQTLDKYRTADGAGFEAKTERVFRKERALQAATALEHALIEIGKNPANVKPSAEYVNLTLWHLRLNRAIKAGAPDYVIDNLTAVLTDAARDCAEAHRSQLSDNPEAVRATQKLSQNEDHYRENGGDHLQNTLIEQLKGLGYGHDTQTAQLLGSIISGEVNFGTVIEVVNKLQPFINRMQKGEVIKIEQIINDLTGTDKPLNGSEALLIRTLYHGDNLGIIQNTMAQELGLTAEDMSQMANPVQYLNSNGDEVIIQAEHDPADSEAQTSARELRNVTDKDMKEYVEKKKRNWGAMLMGFCMGMPMLTGIVGFGGGDKDTSQGQPE